MLTAQQMVFAMLGQIGEWSLTLNQYVDDSNGKAATGVQRAYLNAINRGLSELFDKNPALFKREVGLTVPAPAGGTVSVTNQSTAVSATTLTGPFADHAISIAGQSEFNALRTEGAASKLVFPYTGATGTQPATLYGNAVLLDSTWSKPLGPVWLSDIRILVPLAGKVEYLGYDPYQRMDTDWGRCAMGIRRLPTKPRIAQPEAYYADVHTLEAGTAQIRLFLTPLPEKEYSLRFDAGIRPLPVVIGDVMNDPSAPDDTIDPGRNFPVPDGKDETFLLPLVLYYWSQSEFFKNAALAKQFAIDRAAILPQIEEYKVQIQTGSHIQTSGWR